MNLNDIKEKIYNNNSIYYCLKCGKYLGRLKPIESKNLKCQCNSKLITFTQENDKRRVKALSKFLNKKPMNKNEEKMLEDLMRRADMFLSYSFMAPLTINAKGVGVNTALRILRGYYKTEEEFLKRLMEEGKKK